MTHYFIDTSDQQRFIRDDTGGDYADLDAVKAAAVGVLPDMARDELPDGDTRTFFAMVRDADGASVLLATLTLNVTPLVPDA